jgi:hypothetical protein
VYIWDLGWWPPTLHEKVFNLSQVLYTLPTRHGVGRCWKTTFL